MNIITLQYIVFAVLAIGVLFSIIFHVMVKEVNTPAYDSITRTTDEVDSVNDPDITKEDYGSCSNQNNKLSEPVCPPVHFRMMSTDWLKNMQVNILSPVFIHCS